MTEHIVIGDRAPRVQYVADGVQAVFTYPFPIFDAADLEVLLDGVTLSGGYTVAGAGQSDGGSVTIAAAPRAGTRVTLRRDLPLARTTDFQDNGVLRARTLNDELDYQVAALQQVAEATQRAVRLPADDFTDIGTVPVARASRLLGFDAAGRLAIYPTESAPAPESGMVNARRDYGAAGDGVADDTAALNNAAITAAFQGRVLEIPEGTYRITGPVTVPGAAPGVLMRGTIVAEGAGYAALTLGDGGTARNGEKHYQGIRVVRALQSLWADEAEIGVVLRNLDAGLVEIRQAEGFTIGVRTLGEARGFEDTTITLGRIVNNRIGLDIRTGTVGGWNNSVRYIGGHFGIGSGVNAAADRFAIRFSAAPGAYMLHNRHVFEAPNFELAVGEGIMAIPFLSEVNSRGVVMLAGRMEACSPYVARHTAGAQDHRYELAYVATHGYRVEVDYTQTATRVGAVVQVLHQAGAHIAATRPVGSVPSLRAAAYRWSATETGFDGLACVATNPSGAPTAIAALAARALDGFSLGAAEVTMAAGRGVGFAVNAADCRDFALAPDGSGLRLFVQCFDAGGMVLTSGALVRFSGGSVAWNATARWFETTADLSDANLSRLQSLRIAAGVGYAIIGVYAAGSGAVLRALRLFSPPEQSPALLNGTPFVPAGSRELVGEMAWDPPSIAAGATSQLNVPLAGARPGDHVQAAFSLATTGVLFSGQVGATDTVTVTAWNRTAAAVDLGSGTVRVRLVKS